MGRPTMIRKLAASLALLALVACNQTPQATISAENHAQLQQLITSLLDQTSAQNAQGFSAAPGTSDVIERLQPNENHHWDVNLAAGVSYRFVGVCDAECSNVDMEVLDSSGAVVGSDVLDDDIPIVNLQPA